MTLSSGGGEEQALKGWVVTSVNEWGGDQVCVFAINTLRVSATYIDVAQERILLLTDKNLYRINYDFAYKTVSSTKAIPLVRQSCEFDC